MQSIDQLNISFSRGSSSYLKNIPYDPFHEPYEQKLPHELLCQYNRNDYYTACLLDRHVLILIENAANFA